VQIERLTLISVAKVKPAYIWKLQVLFGKDYTLGEENIKSRLAEPQKTSRRDIEKFPIPSITRISPRRSQEETNATYE
jgi:hypothetical protein